MVTSAAASAYDGAGSPGSEFGERHVNVPLLSRQLSVESFKQWLLKEYQRRQEFGDEESDDETDSVGSEDEAVTMLADL